MARRFSISLFLSLSLYELVCVCVCVVKALQRLLAQERSGDYYRVIDCTHTHTLSLSLSRFLLLPPVLLLPRLFSLCCLIPTNISLRIVLHSVKPSRPAGRAAVLQDSPDDRALQNRHRPLPAPSSRHLFSTFRRT
jgi:hypothetical protein